MRESNQGEEGHGHGCEWLAAASFSYPEHLHCRTSWADRSVTMKSCCKSLVELALHSRGLRLSQEMDMGVERRAFVDIICTPIAVVARVEWGLGLCG